LWQRNTGHTPKSLRMPKRTAATVFRRAEQARTARVRSRLQPCALFRNTHLWTSPILFQRRTLFHQPEKCWLIKAKQCIQQKGAPQQLLRPNSRSHSVTSSRRRSRPRPNSVVHIAGRMHHHPSWCSICQQPAPTNVAGRTSQLLGPRKRERRLAGRSSFLCRPAAASMSGWRTTAKMVAHQVSQRTISS